jgi:hypothetical protein
MPTHTPEPAFPEVIVLRGRNYVWRSAFERYKADLVRHTLSGRYPPPPPPPGPDTLIPLKLAAAELGVGRRTIGRRLKQTTDAAAAVAGRDG